MQYTAECLVSPLRFLLGSTAYMMLPLKSHAKYLRGIKRLRRLVDGVIQLKLDDAALNTKQATSLLDIMLQERASAIAANARNQAAAVGGSGSGSPQQTHKPLIVATLEEIRDQVGTFLAAGHETTASLLSFAMLHISARPGKNYLAADKGHFPFHFPFST